MPRINFKELEQIKSKKDIYGKINAQSGKGDIKFAVDDKGLIYMTTFKQSNINSKDFITDDYETAIKISHKRKK